MKNKRRFTIIVLSSLLLVFQLVAAVAYGFFDMTKASESESITTGVWIWDNPNLEHDFAIEYNEFIQQAISDGLTDYGDIYTQSITSTSPKYVSNINLYNIDWDFTSYTYSLYGDYVGFPQLVDRGLESIDTADYDINPNYEDYNNYEYFIVDDVLNTQTRNQFSLRLNYYTVMSSSEPIENLTNISFYAKLGLQAENDLFPMREDTILYVQFSYNQKDWKTVGKIYPERSTEEEESFPYYSFDKPSSLKKYDDIYVRFIYYGYPKRTKIYSRYYQYQYGRVVIDDLTFNTD